MLEHRSHRSILYLFGQAFLFRTCEGLQAREPAFQQPPSALVLLI